jgi:hypothetical protein
LQYSITEVSVGISTSVLARVRTGTLTAPGMYPSAYSDGSRTSAAGDLEVDP